MAHATTEPVRLLAGEAAEHQASLRAEQVEALLVEHHGRSLTTDERYAALASLFMTLLADRGIDEVRAVLARARADLLLGFSSGRIVSDLISEVRNG